MKRLIIFLCMVPLCGFSQTVNSIVKTETWVMSDRPWLASHTLFNEEPAIKDLPEGVTEVTHRRSESLHPEVSIYPVVAVDKLTIYRTTQFQAQYKILSSSGKVVLQGKLKLPREEIKIASLPKDYYLIEVTELEACTRREIRK